MLIVGKNERSVLFCCVCLCKLFWGDCFLDNQYYNIRITGTIITGIC